MPASSASAISGHICVYVLSKHTVFWLPKPETHVEGGKCEPNSCGSERAKKLPSRNKNTKPLNHTGAKPTLSHEWTGKRSLSLGRTKGRAWALYWPARSWRCSDSSGRRDQEEQTTLLQQGWNQNHHFWCCPSAVQAQMFLWFIPSCLALVAQSERRNKMFKHEAPTEIWQSWWQRLIWSRALPPISQHLLGAPCSPGLAGQPACICICSIRTQLTATCSWANRESHTGILLKLLRNVPCGWWAGRWESRVRCYKKASLFWAQLKILLPPNPDFLINNFNLGWRG